MILLSLQIVSCLGLLAVSLAASKGNEKAHPLFLPLIIFSSLMGVALLYPYAMEIFVAHYSGANCEIEALTYRLNGPYRWIYYSSVILPLVPMGGLIPVVRKHHLLVAALAFLGAAPAIFRISQDLVFG